MADTLTPPAPYVPALGDTVVLCVTALDGAQYPIAGCPEMTVIHVNLRQKEAGLQWFDAGARPQEKVAGFGELLKVGAKAEAGFKELPGAAAESHATRKGHGKA